eukprot:COSAG02_NODE_2243_length_9392_cov_12.624449_9_plen_58_part_00
MMCLFLHYFLLHLHRTQETASSACSQLVVLDSMILQSAHMSRGRHDIKQGQLRPLWR